MELLWNYDYQPNYAEEPYLQIIGSASGFASRNVILETGSVSEFKFTSTTRKYFIIPGKSANNTHYFYSHYCTSLSQSNSHSMTYDYDLLWSDQTTSETSVDTSYFPRRVSTTDQYGESATIRTNLPIFASTESARQFFFGDHDLRRILNYPNEVEENNNKWYIRCNYQTGNWSYDGVSNTSSTIYRWYEFTATDAMKVALYRIGASTELRLKTSGGAILYDRWSDNGASWYEGEPSWNEYYSSRTNQLGLIKYALNYDTMTNIPVWESEEDADAYLNGEKDISEATNYGYISDGKNIDNKTGLPEASTTFGVPTHRDAFNKRYIMTHTQLKSLYTNYISNPDEIENIILGLSMWGNAKPIEFICDVCYYPFDIVDLFPTAPTRFIHFGTYPIELAADIPVLANYSGYIDMGAFTLEPTFNSFRDFEPYSNLYVQLPYVGSFKLDIARYLKKSINVRYYIDFNTHTCCACLIADGVLMDYYNGQIGVVQSMSSTDFMSYMNSQVSTLIGSGTTALIGAATGAAVGGPAGAVVGGLGGVVSGSVEAYNNGLNGPQVNSMGTSSSMINEYLPQYVYFIYEIPITDESDNLITVKGKPSNRGGSIGSFSGYLQVDSVDLHCASATEEEKNEIISLLKSGIRI